jgi:hypothetical protein
MGLEMDLETESLPSFGRDSSLDAHLHTDHIAATRRRLVSNQADATPTSRHQKHAHYQASSWSSRKMLSAVLGNAGGEQSESDSASDSDSENYATEWQGWRRDDIEQKRNHGPHGARECEVTASVLGLPGISGSEAYEIQDMPLHVFVRSGDSILFQNSLIHALLEHKWRSYAKGFFYRELFFYILFLCNWAGLALSLDWFHSQCPIDDSFNLTTTDTPTATTRANSTRRLALPSAPTPEKAKIGVLAFFGNFGKDLLSLVEFRPASDAGVGRGRTILMGVTMCMLLVLCVRSMLCWWKRIKSRSSWSFVCEDDDSGAEEPEGMMQVLGSFASRSKSNEKRQKRRATAKSKDKDGEPVTAADAMAAAANAARKTNVLNRAREKFKSLTKQNRELTRQPSILVSKRHTEKQLAHASTVLTGHGGSGSATDYGYVLWLPFLCCRRRCFRRVCCCCRCCCCGRARRKGSGTDDRNTHNTSSSSESSHSGSGMHLKLGMSSWWDILDPIIFVCVMLSLYFIVRCNPSTRPLIAFTTIVIIIKAFYFSRGNDKLAALVRMITQIATDMQSFMTIFTGMWMSCALAFFVLYERTDEPEPPGYIDITFDGIHTKTYDNHEEECYEDDERIHISSLAEAIVHTMNMAIGEALTWKYLNCAPGPFGPFVAKALTVIFYLMMYILLLNLLIAIMNDSYSKIQVKSDMETAREKACIIVDLEVLLRLFDLLLQGLSSISPQFTLLSTSRHPSVLSSPHPPPAASLPSSSRSPSPPPAPTGHVFDATPHNRPTFPLATLLRLFLGHTQAGFQPP